MVTHPLLDEGLSHLVGALPRILIVDGSRLVRKLIADVLRDELPGVEIVACGTLAEAKTKLTTDRFDLVTTALLLPDGDGQQLAHAVRDTYGARYVPVIVVSGDAQAHLEARSFTDDVTDYFDKADGHRALASFIRGYVAPKAIPGAHVLYVEDSRTVAIAIVRMLQAHGLEITHLLSAEAAIDWLRARHGDGQPGTDLVLTDLYLEGALSGQDVLRVVRQDMGYGKRKLPVLVMTGDSNRANQAALLHAGANDLVVKPIEERLLLTKVLFQLRLSMIRCPRDPSVLAAS